MLRKNRHTFQIRTSVDPRRPFDQQLLDTLKTLQRVHSVTESRAIMHLLWLGWHAYHGRPAESPPLEVDHVSGSPLGEEWHRRVIRPRTELHHDSPQSEPPAAVALAADTGSMGPSLSANSSGDGLVLRKLRALAYSRDVAPVAADVSSRLEAVPPSADLAGSLGKVQLQGEGRQYP